MEQVLYDLPEGWNLETIGEVASKLVTGKTPSTKKTEYYSSSEVDWFTPSDFGSADVLSNSRRKLSSLAIEDGTIKRMPKGSVLLVAIGATIGKVGLAEDESCFNQQVTGMYFKEKIHPKYAYYWLSYIKPEIIAKSSQATLPIINQTGIKGLSFLYPEKEEQKRIVEKLDALLTRIDNAIEHLQESVTLADALFKSTLSSLVCDESNEYKKLSLEELGSFSGGGTPSKSKSEFWNGEILWVTPKDMKSPVITDSELKITKEGVSGSSAKFIPPKSILIVARSGILRHTLPVCINEAECTVNQDIKVFIPNERISSEYAQHMLKGYESFILSELVKGGVTVESLKYKDFQNFKFPVPSVEQQKKIVDELSKTSQLTTPAKTELVGKIEHLKQLKSSILDSAFKGEL